MIKLNQILLVCMNCISEIFHRRILLIFFLSLYYGTGSWFELLNEISLSKQFNGEKELLQLFSGGLASFPSNDVTEQQNSPWISMQRLPEGKLTTL